MNKRSEFPNASPQVAAPLGARAAGKARSRQSLVEAARRLFMERGYNRATVRDIAAEAGLSTGAVFASFVDKSDLFVEVLKVDCEVQVQAMREALDAADGDVADRLVALLAAGYAHHLPQLRLLRAAMGVSWSEGLPGSLGDRPVREPVTRLIAEVLHDGGYPPGPDRDLLVETIWNAHVANFRHALYGGAGLEDLKRRLARQLKLLLPRNG